MGIINITPDSFYSGSHFRGTDGMLQLAEQMLNDGADILDLGGQSTRPGSERISADAELKRVMGPLNAILENFPGTIISIDTYHSKVAEESVGAGAAIVNDISAGMLDPRMIPVIAKLRVPYVLMHMKGSPETMQNDPGYENTTSEVLDFFIQKLQALREAGIADVIVDPGFGFGKNAAHNFELLRNLSVFKMLNCPILLGISRKATIYKTLGKTAGEALNGTTVLHTIGLINGAGILRVHDVKEAKEAVLLYNACYG